MSKQTVILLIFLIGFSSCRKFVWDNPNDTINPDKEPASLKDGLVAYYPFNGNANDESGNGYSGTVNGAVLTENRFGELNKAYSFDGKSYILTSVNQLNSPITLSVWFKSDTPIIGTPGLISSRSGLVNLTGISFINGNTIFFEVNNGPQYRNSSVLPEMNNNKWHSIIATCTNDSSKIFYDGLLKSVQKVTLGGAIIASPVHIGFDNIVASDNRYWVGQLDDIRIYNRALTQEEITYLSKN